MNSGKEITIRASDVEIGIQNNNQNIVFQDNNLLQIPANQDTDRDINNQPVLAFKNISQISVNKDQGGYGVQKKSKVKNINFWVQKNRSQLQQKQQQKQGNQFQQKPLFNNNNQIEDQENQLRPNVSNVQAGITLDLKRDPFAKSPDQSPIMGPMNQSSKNENIIKDLALDRIDEGKQSSILQSVDKKNRSSKSNKSNKDDKKDQKKYAIAEKGYEWDLTIKNDNQLLNKLLDEGKYRPSKEWKEQFEKDISEILLGSEVQDKRAVGSLLGITVFGIVGFVASGLNPIGLVAGAVAGGVIGQYAGRKIKKKLLRTKKLLQFDLFTLKLNCYIKFGQELMKPFKFDVNTYRFYIEKVIEEMKVAIQYRRFRQKFHKDIKKILEKFLRLMKKDHCYKAIFLSYKLTKEIIERKKQQENNIPQFTAQEEEQIIDSVLNVLSPTLNILRDSPENLTPPLKTFQFKLEKLLKDYVILSLIEKGNQVTSNKNKTIKQIEELDQQLDQEINIEAFERIFNPEHIKQFINKEDQMTLSQAKEGQIDNLHTPKIAESALKNKNHASTQQRKSHQIKIGQDGDNQELSSFNNNNQNQNELNKQAEDDMRSSGQGQEKRQQRIIDLYIQAMEMRNKVLSSQKKEEENDIGEDENGNKNDELMIDDQSNKKKGSQNIPSQYPTFSKQHLSKISKKEVLIQSPQNPYNNNQDELIEMDRINQRQTSNQMDARLIDQSSFTTTTNNQELGQVRKVSNIQIKFDQIPRKQLDVDQESIKSQGNVEQNDKMTMLNIKSLTENKKNGLNIPSSTNNNQNNNQQVGTLNHFQAPSSSASQQNFGPNNIQNIQNHPSQPNYMMRESNRSFARNDNRTFLKMNSEESLFSKKEQSPKNEKQIQLEGDIDQPMKDSVMHSQIIPENKQDQIRMEIDTPKRKSNFNILEPQKRGSILGKQINLQNSQVSVQKPNSQFRQSIISRDDNNQEEIVIVNIPEIQKDEKMSQSIHKEENGGFDPQTKEKFDRLISLVQEDPEKTWECVIKKDNCMFIYKKMIPGNPCVLVRAESTIKDCTAEEVFVQIYNADIRSQWDKVTLGFSVLEKISEDVDVIYFYVDPGLGVTKRDFCQTRVLKRDYPVKGQITIVFFSISHPSCPERKGFIRAFSHIAGYVIRPLGNDTSLTIMTQSDVKGIVPKYVVNFMAARAPPKWIESMRKGCIDYRSGKSGTQKKKK